MRTGGQTQADIREAEKVQAVQCFYRKKAKGASKHTRLSNLALTVTQDMEENCVYPKTATNEKIQKHVLKIFQYEKLRQEKKSLHTEYLKFIPVYKHDNVQDFKKL